MAGHADSDQPAARVDATPSGENPRRAPWWAPVAFLGLLLAAFAFAQWVSHSGAEITWIRNDLPAALEQSARTDRRVLLVMYEPGDPIAAEHDRRLFSQRSIREYVAQFVPCRIEVAPGDALRTRYGFRGPPLMVVLNSAGEPLMPAQEGKIDERRFRTYMIPGSARTSP